MLFHSYLRHGAVYVPTVVKLKTGAYMDVEPVAVVPVANSDALHRAFLAAMARQNAIIPNPPKDDWPPPVLLKYAGVKTWSAFARGTSLWSINEKDAAYQIVGYRSHPQGYWVEDREQKIGFPAGSTVEDVIERMIAILREAARR